MATKKSNAATNPSDREDVRAANALRARVEKFNADSLTRSCLTAADEQELDAILADAVSLPGPDLYNRPGHAAREFVDRCRATSEIAVGGEIVTAPAIENPSLRRRVDAAGCELLDKIDDYVNEVEDRACTKVDHFNEQVEAIRTALLCDEINLLLRAVVAHLRLAINEHRAPLTVSAYPFAIESLVSALVHAIVAAKEAGRLPSRLPLILAGDTDLFLSAFEAATAPQKEKVA